MDTKLIVNSCKLSLTDAFFLSKLQSATLKSAVFCLFRLFFCLIRSSIESKIRLNKQNGDGLNEELFIYPSSQKETLNMTLQHYSMHMARLQPGTVKS